MSSRHLEPNHSFLLEQQNFGEWKICPFCSHRQKPKTKQLDSVNQYMYMECETCERFLLKKTVNKTIKKLYFVRTDEVSERRYKEIQNEQQTLI